MSDLLEAIKNIDNCIIKPSKDSSAGIGVRSLRVTDDIVSDYDGSLEKLITRATLLLKRKWFVATT